MLAAPRTIYSVLKIAARRYLGMLAGLQDPAIFEKKLDSEKELRDSVAKDPKLSQSYGDGWDQVAATLKTQFKIREEYNLFAIGPQRRAQSFNSDLFDIAIKLVRLAEETFQTKFRTSAGIFRGRTRFPETSALLRRADL